MAVTRALIVLALVSCVAACRRATQLPAPPDIATSAALTAVSTCQDLRARIAGTASTQMRMTLESYREGAWGMFGDARGAGGPTASPPAPSSGPAGTTGTNNQVAGVDEGDFVKSDGTRLLVLSGTTLWLSKSWPPKDLALAASVTIEGWPTELQLDEKGRAVVFSMVQDLWTKAGEDGRAIAPCPMGMPCFWGNLTTKITVLDVSDVAAPKVIDEHWLPGSLRASRRVGAAVRAVLVDDVRWPKGVRLWPDWRDEYRGKDAWNRALDALIAENDRIIAAAPLESWLPQGKRRLRDGGVIDVGYRCTDFWAESAPVRLGLATVATLDLDAQSPPARTSIVGEANVVYSSEKTLYLAEHHWWWWPRPGQRDWTYVHAFDVSDPSRAQYVASGGLDGHPLNQFSLDEFDGALRVATLLMRRVDDPAVPWGRLEVENRVSVLRRQAGQLRVVGQTPVLAKDEALRAVRFTGDRGYVVTFRGVDPLFALDLSKADQPRVRGELKVPGFSTYLHPIDPDNLIAVGIDLPEPGPDGRVDWSLRHMKLSMFDVGDLDAPRLRHGLLVGTAHGWTEAAWDHHAFTWAGPRKLLALPFSDWQPGAADYWGAFVSDLKLFKVDVATGFSPIGALGLKDLYAGGDRNAFYGWYSPWVRRSVISTDQGGTDWVYAISDAGIRVAAAGALDKPVATVAFPRPSAAP